MQRKQFTFYRSYYEAMSKLSVSARGRLLDLVIQYALDGTEPVNLTAQQHLAFTLIKPNLDAARRRALGGMKGKPFESQVKATEKPAENPDKDPANKGEKEIEKETKKEIKKEIEIKTEIEGEGERHALGSGVSGFDIFWDLFPVKFGREAARAVWIKKGLEEAAVVPGLKKWLRSSNWRKENGKYIPRAAKFLEEEHYIQDPPGDIPMGCSGELGKAELEAIAAVMKGT